jgi:hypothetical protein
MRASAIYQDAGWVRASQRQHLKVFVDGVMVDEWITADEDEGFVDVPEGLTSRQFLLHEANDIPTIRLEGAVSIEAPTEVRNLITKERRNSLA